MKTISVYCDGSSTGSSKGAIGWGWIVTDWEEIICAGCEGAPVGTNNIAELQAAIYGLKAVLDRGLHVGNAVELVSDSTYTLNLANGTYQPNKYHEIVGSLQSLFQQARAKTRWVRGHSGDAFNEKADKLAKSAKEKYTVGDAKKRRKSKRRMIKQVKKALVRDALRERDNDAADQDVPGEADSTQP